MQRDGKLLLTGAVEPGKGEAAVLQNTPLDDETACGAVIRRVARTMEPFIGASSRDPALASDAYIQKAGVRSVLGVPVVRKGKLTGVLYVEHHLAESAFTERHLKTLVLLASQAAISLENAYLYEDLRTALDAQVRLTSAHQRFVPSQFLESIGRTSITDVRIGDNVQKEMSIIFTDIRGFTSLVEGMRPDEVMGFINQFLRHMDPAIRNNGGFVDSFIGDAILGLFDGGADRAVCAGVEMLRTLTRLNVQRARTNSAPIRMGIGINTGVLTLGTMGSDDHLKCGVLGDSVNLAARVESLTKAYGCSLLITGHTFRGLTAATEYRIRLVDHVRVMGKAEVVDLYEVYDADEPDLCARKDRAAPLWALARERYVAGDMAAARARFQEYGRAVGDDSVAALFAERCERFLKVGLPEAWSGVTDLDHK